MSYYNMYIVSMVCIYYDYFLRILTVFSYISGIELWQTGATIVVLATQKSLQCGSTPAKICENLETSKIPHWRVSYAKDSPGNHAQLAVEAPGSSHSPRQEALQTNGTTICCGGGCSMLRWWLLLLLFLLWLESQNRMQNAVAWYV